MTPMGQTWPRGGPFRPHMPETAMKPFQNVRAAILLLVSVLALSAPAQGARAAGYIPQAQERYRIFVFGDRMATGLLAGLWRVLKDRPKFVARGRLREGSGLARPKYYDWPRVVSGTLDSNEADIAIVMLGANDARDMLENGRKLLFGSPEWKQAYARRVAGLMAAFRSRQVALYWVGLPPVRDPGRNEALKFITDIIRQQAKAAGVRFVDIYQDFATEEGGYVENGFDVDGKMTRLRARNGVQFIKAGNTKLASLVMEAIRRDVDAAEGRADAAVANAPEAQQTAGASSAGTVDLNAMPEFGRRTPAGGAEIVRAEDLPDRNAAYLDRAAGAPEEGGEAQLAKLRRMAAPRSPAWRLFREGVWPKAPAGRADDFSLVKPDG